MDRSGRSGAVDLDELQEAVAGHERRASGTSPQGEETPEMHVIGDTAEVYSVNYDDYQKLETPSNAEVRECVRAGQQKRSLMKKSTSKRILGHTHAALLTFATMVSCVGGFLAEPGR